MKSRRKSPTPEPKAVAQARRAELIARTLPLQATRKSGLLHWAELPTVNACLALIYTGETGRAAAAHTSALPVPLASYRESTPASASRPRQDVIGSRIQLRENFTGDGKVFDHEMVSARKA